MKSKKLGIFIQKFTELCSCPLNTENKSPVQRRELNIESSKKYRVLKNSKIEAKKGLIIVIFREPKKNINMHIKYEGFPTINLFFLSYFHFRIVALHVILYYYCLTLFFLLLKLKVSVT